MKKVFGQTVRDLKREVNKKVLKVPGVEQKVLDATSNEPWGPHGSLLADIAMATRNYHELQMIMSVIWKRISDTGKNWRHVYKGLAVLEYLVAHGSERVIDEIREHAYQISMLSDFLYIDSSGRDQGTNVRKKSQSLVALVNDKERIIEVREKAAANRDKFPNTPMGGMHRPDSGGYGDKYDYDRYEGRYRSRDDDRSGYGRERESGYGDDRYSRDGDRYGRDHEDRYGRDGYRDDEYRGRSRGDENYQYGLRGRSSDRERAYEDDDQSSTRASGARADDQSQDGSQHERKFSGQNNGAAPSYEEAVSESQSPVHAERIGETSIASAPKAASPIASDHPSQASFTADNSTSPIKDGEVFDEFDPRSTTSANSTITAPAKAVPTASTGAEFDLLGSLSDDTFSSNAMPTLPSTGGNDAQANPSAVPSFISSQSMTNADNQAFDDPFGDGPFRAITPTQSAIAQEQTSTSVPSFQAPSTNSQFLPQELSSSNQDIDILAGILPPSGPSDAVASQTPFSAPTSQPSQPGLADQPSQPGPADQPSQPGPADQPSQPGGYMYGQPGQTGPNMFGQLGLQGNDMFAQPTQPSANLFEQPGQPTPSSHSSSNPYSQQPQPAGQQPQPSPYNQMAQSGANLNGQQAQPGANPYGQQAQPGANPYGQQAQPGANPYGQQAQPGANPYGQQAQPGANPYGQQAQPGANPYGQQAYPGANGYGQQAYPGANGYGQPAQPGTNPYGQLGQPNVNNTYGGYNPQPGPGTIVPFGSNTTHSSSGPSAQSSAGDFSHGVPTSPINPQMTQPQSPAAPTSPFNGGNIIPQQGSAAQQNAVPGNIFSQAGPNSSMAPQSVGSSSTGTLAIVPQASKEKFEPKSSVWADTLSRGLVNLNISGPKTNPLADIGVDFDAINRKEKRMEKSAQSPVTSTITMGKAMGAGTGMGRAGASSLRPAPNPMVSPGMGLGMGANTGMNPGMGMGVNTGMNPGIGMGANAGLNPGMGMGGYGGMNQQPMGMGGYGGMNQQPMGMGMGPNMRMNPSMGMNMGMGQGFNMQPQTGMPPGSTMQGNYNPMMGQGGYPPQQQFGGSYR